VYIKHSMAIMKISSFESGAARIETFRKCDSQYVRSIFWAEGGEYNGSHRVGGVEIW
jgi:hypothetical protein